MAVTIPAHRNDPTGTHTLRERYRRHLQRPLNTLITDIRTAVIEEDIFGLRVDTLADDDLPPVMRLDRDARKEDLFREWLERRLEQGVLEQIDRGENTYIRSAYSRGAKDADRLLKAAGIDPRGDVDDIFNMGVHQRALEDLFAANYEDLEDITTALSDDISRTLAEGFAAGEGPRTIARRLTDRVDAVGKTRAEMLARTRIIDAHSTATLNRYEQFGVTSVEVQAEWRTAQDDRVCPICEALEGRTWTTERVRTGTFEFEPGEDDDAHLAGTYPIKPPAHPRCRCALLPSIQQ